MILAQDEKMYWPEDYTAKSPTDYSIGLFKLAPGDDLLSHGDTPHYHRRGVISLLSSVWDQVVLTLYGRQAKLVCIRGY